MYMTRVCFVSLALSLRRRHAHKAWDNKLIKPVCAQNVWVHSSFGSVDKTDLLDQKRSFKITFWRTKFYHKNKYLLTNATQFVNWTNVINKFYELKIPTYQSNTASGRGMSNSPTGNRLATDVRPDCLKAKNKISSSRYFAQDAFFEMLISMLFWTNFL